MAIPDAPDFQRTVVTVTVAMTDAPDFQEVVVSPGGSAVGGYASLTGPGETVTPGALTQAGNFTVNGTSTIYLHIGPTGTGTLGFAQEGTGGINLGDTGGGGIGAVTTANVELSSQTGTVINDAGTQGIRVSAVGGPLVLEAATFYQIESVPVYADNAAAITGGLPVGGLYRTGADPDPLSIVH